MHAKILKLKRPKVCWRSSLPQKTLLLKRPDNSPTFNSVTLWHRTVSYICIIHTACSPGRSEAISPWNPKSFCRNLNFFHKKQAEKMAAGSAESSLVNTTKKSEEVCKRGFGSRCNFWRPSWIHKNYLRKFSPCTEVLFRDNKCLHRFSRKRVALNC